MHLDRRKAQKWPWTATLRVLHPGSESTLTRTGWLISSRMELSGITLRCSRWKRRNIKCHLGKEFCKRKCRREFHAMMPYRQKSQDWWAYIKTSKVRHLLRRWMPVQVNLRIVTTTTGTQLVRLLEAMPCTKVWRLRWVHDTQGLSTSRHSSVELSKVLRTTSRCIQRASKLLLQPLRSQVRTKSVVRPHFSAHSNRKSLVWARKILQVNNGTSATGPRSTTYPSQSGKQLGSCLQ